MAVKQKALTAGQSGSTIQTASSKYLTSVGELLHFCLPKTLVPFAQIASVFMGPVPPSSNKTNWHQISQNLTPFRKAVISEATLLFSPDSPSSTYTHREEGQGRNTSDFKSLTRMFLTQKLL